MDHVPVLWKSPIACGFINFPSTSSITCEYIGVPSRAPLPVNSLIFPHNKPDKLIWGSLSQFFRSLKVSSHYASFKKPQF